MKPASFFLMNTDSVSNTKIKLVLISNANDIPDVCQTMICNFRHAEVGEGRACKIMRDLTGYKIYMGLIEAASSAHNI